MTHIKHIKTKQRTQLLPKVAWLSGLEVVPLEHGSDCAQVRSGVMTSCLTSRFGRRHLNRIRCSVNSLQSFCFSFQVLELLIEYKSQTSLVSFSSTQILTFIILSPSMFHPSITLLPPPLSSRPESSPLCYPGSSWMF
jgi:hypothetical protein